MTIDENTLTRFQQLIPFYLNGTLSAEDQLFIDDALKNHPELEKYVEFDRRIQKAVLEQSYDFNVSASYAAFRQKLPKQKSVPWWQRRDFNIFQRYAAPLMTVCLVIIVGQSLYIFNHNPLSEIGQYRGLSAGQPKLTEYKLILKPSARFADITGLLQVTHCQIISGPNMHGQLVLGCESNSSTIQTMLSDSPLVNDVLPVK